MDETIRTFDTFSASLREEVLFGAVVRNMLIALHDGSKLRDIECCYFLPSFLIEALEWRKVDWSLCAWRRKQNLLGGRDTGYSVLITIQYLVSMPGIRDP